MLLKKANTITTPTAYSNGFLHSVKPEVVENLLLQSNQFDTTWGNSNSTETGGQADKDGGTDAWRIDKTASGGYLVQNIGTSGVQTFSVYAKAGTTDWMQLLTLGSGTGSRYVFYDLTNGVIGSQSGSGTYGIDSNIESVGGGWYRCSLTFNTTLNDVRVYPAEANSTAATSGSIYIQDAQLNKGLTAYPYLETTTEAKPSADFTFTRNSSATRVNELGYIEDVQIIGGELVSNGDFEEIGSELVTNGSFDTDSDWVKGTGWSIGNGKASCDGTQTANSVFYQFIGSQSNKIIKISFSVSDYVSGTLETSFFGASGTQTYSVTSDGDYVFYVNVQSGHNGNTGFTARVGFQGSIDNVSVKEVGQDWSFGTGWTMGDGVVVGTSVNKQFMQQPFTFVSGKKYRTTCTVTGTDTLTNDLCFRLPYDGKTVNIAYATKGQDGVYTHEFVSTGGSFVYFGYIDTGTFTGTVDNISVKEVTDDTNLPRINYEGFTYENGLPVPYSGKGHLLLEPQRSNLITYSEDFSQWLDQSSPTLTSNFGISPDGSQNADKLTASANSSAKRIAFVLSPSTIYTASIFLKNIDSSRSRVECYSGTGGNPVIEIDWNGYTPSTFASYNTSNIEYIDYGNNWWRVNYTFTSDASLTNYQTYVYPDRLNASDSILAWGAMIEQGSYATSYIFTNGTAVTRLGETCNNATHSFPSEGVLYAEIAALANDGGFRQISINDATSNNIVQIDYTSTSNQIRGVVISGGSLSALILFVSSDVTLFSKVALRYKENDFSLWVDGVEVGTDISGTVSSGLTKLSFDNGSGNNDFYGKTKMVATFPYLSNDEMECLTGEGYGTFEALASAYSYTIK